MSMGEELTLFLGITFNTETTSSSPSFPVIGVLVHFCTFLDIACKNTIVFAQFIHSGFGDMFTSLKYTWNPGGGGI